MPRIIVEASRIYDVLIDELTLDDAGTLARQTVSASRALVISDSNVAPRYASRVIESLRASGIETSLHVFPAGEASKTLATYAQCLNACCEAELSRTDLIVALGGGVVGDIAGFTAATYMRGCSCIQIPTSLLACVDSSVGGKTAVDLPAGKNLVGAFFQPSAVLIDTSVLSTLDHHFFTDGCAEIIKYGAIADARLLCELANPLRVDDPRLPRIIMQCVAIKRDIVSADEHEAGIRQLLNFGHTLGHAIEQLSDFTVTHGFAVACGMSLAASGGCASGATDADAAQAIISALKAAGLPVTLGECGMGRITADELYAAALSDKKRHGSTINMILATTFGKAQIVRMDLAEFKEFVIAATDKER